MAGRLLKLSAYYKTRNAGIGKNDTRNTDGTVEHPEQWQIKGTPQNTSETPWNTKKAPT